MMAQLKNPLSYSLKELLKNFSAENLVDDIFIKGLSIDSRNIEAEYLFVAVEGVSSHGKNFIDSAIKNGACAVLIDKNESLIDCNIPIIKIPQLQKYLSEIAGRFYQHPSLKVSVYGITGTNGKTTCSHLLAKCLAANDVNCGVMGTLGYAVIKADKNSKDLSDVIQSQSTDNDTKEFITTGMTTTDAINTQRICLELVSREAKVIVMEVSSHGLAQYRVENIDINTAIFTNLTHDHLDYHGSMKAYGDAKARLFDMPSVVNAVINQDDDFSEVLIKKLQKKVRIATYSLNKLKAKYSESIAHFSFSDTTYTGQGVAAILNTPEGEFAIRTQLVGAFNLSNILAVISSLYLNNYSLEKVISILPSLKSVSGRMELVTNKLNLQVVIDFAHTPDALKNALEALSLHQHNKIWCVFGCGGDRDVDKRSKMAKIAEQMADYVVVTNDNPRTESSENIFNDIKQGFSREHKIIENRGDAIAYAIDNADKGDVVLIAGKGHENYQIIGSKKIPFSDQEQARLKLKNREQEMTL
jgi:UDP-N-acetylmuramoyl-L-alanyl-D-glutamate--2,6-diaminopimelate ligase